MDVEEFRTHGKEMIDYVADYIENISTRRPFPDVKPGYIRDLIPDQCPEDGEKWKDIFEDIERVIMPGVTHWQHPDFHAYYPAMHSYPALLANILKDAIGCNGFSWILQKFNAEVTDEAGIKQGMYKFASSPACTELEVVTLDWLGKMIDLPEVFLSCSKGSGGGVIQSTASEATLVALLSARTRQIQRYKAEHTETEEAMIMSKFVAYSSDQAHSCMERACLISCIKLRSLVTDANTSLRGQTLQDAVEKDKADGLIPIFVCATLGTTASCAFDNTVEIGAVCEKEHLWLHIDAAYAGSAFICPEYRHFLKGVEYAESFNFNPSKWMQVNFDCSAMWVKDSKLISETFNVNPLFLRHDFEGQMPDFRHWQIPLGRGFRSLKLWFVMRVYGKRGLQECIRKDIRLAKEFEMLINGNDKFEVVGKVILGLVCFRLKGSNEVNERLLKAINTDRRIHVVPGSVKGVYFIRFVICSPKTNSSDVKFAWTVIQEMSD